jgi:hypothetical protein
MPANLILSPFARETIADWNNRGGDCLQRGDLVRALDCFREAHSQLSASHRSATAKAVVGDSEEDATLTSTNTSRVSVPPSTTTTTDLTFIPDDATNHYQTAPSTTTVYTEAIPIPTGKGSFASDQSIEYFNMCSSSCIVFNVALIYHLKALMEVNCHKRQQQMLKAKSLYDKCTRLIFAQGIGYCVSKHPILDLLSMAVLNNYAHVSYELYEFEKTKKYSDCLKYVASLIDPSIYGNPEVEAVILQAKHTFCLNILFALQPPIVAEAA